MSATFSDYWRGVPGDRGRKVDWAATFRNWIRKDVERRKGPHNGRSRQGNLVEAGLERLEQIRTRRDDMQSRDGGDVGDAVVRLLSSR